MGNSNSNSKSKSNRIDKDYVVRQAVCNYCHDSKNELCESEKIKEIYKK